jgi:ABC-2 type transport system ATP-binding protein
MNILSIDGISKSYGRISALKDLSLRVEKGQVYGILGPNGSGKTTTLSVILGIVTQDSGSYSWFNNKYGARVRTKLGALLETPNFYPYLNADDNLAIIRQIKRSEEKDFTALLDLVHLSDRRRSKFFGYSLGMRQRLAIAAAMVGNPEVLILDEPTNGLDPEGIADVRETINAIAETGKTIIMASHMLDEVEKVCSHVAILKEGRLLTEGSVSSILSKNILIEVGAHDMEGLLSQLQTINQVLKITRRPLFFEVAVPDGFDPTILNNELMQRGVALRHLNTKRNRLEDDFLEITK